MGPINMALLSFAHFHGYSYARAVKDLPEARLIAVADDDVPRGKEAAQRYGVEFYQNYSEVLKRKDVDAVIIAAENAKHAQIAIDAAEAKKHILCEKPIATKLSDADSMLRAVKNAGVKFQTCFVMRYHTAANLIYSVLKRGDIGKVVAMTGTNQLKRLMSGWFIEPELSGGGAVMDHTVHLADMMRWYTGSEAERVYCEIGKNVNRDFKVEDCFLTMVNFRNGAVGTIDGSWNRPASYHTWGHLTMEVIGTEGMVLLDAFRQVVYVVQSEAPSNRLEWVGWGCDPDKEMIRDFMKCIREDLKPKASGFDGRQALEITLASYKSAKKGAPVTLPLQS